jgi:hypothetical protein
MTEGDELRDGQRYKRAEEKKNRGGQITHGGTMASLSAFDDMECFLRSPHAQSELI